MGAGQSRVERLNWGEPSDPCYHGKTDVKPGSKASWVEPGHGWVKPMMMMMMMMMINVDLHFTVTF